jgi:hypothetical protein
VSGQSLIRRQVPDDLGHYTSLTPEVHQRVLKELKVGDWPGLAAYRARVSAKSIKRWIDKGLEDVPIEPYASFAADCIEVESEIAGRLMRVILDDAMGETPEPLEGMRRPNVESAKWLLERRFRFFWGKTAEGQPCPGAVSIVETVERQMMALDEGKRDKARKILAALPNEARAQARKDGFLL